MSSFNILYILEQIYALFGGTSEASLQSGLLLAVQNVEWAALGISVALLIAIIAFRLRLEALEHTIHHERTEQELAALRLEQAKPKNPRWQQVMALATSSHPSDWRRAVIEADSLLANLLTARGFVGSTIGEQLSGATTANFATLDLARQAHGVRNRIAHEGEEFLVTERDAVATIDLYRRVFEEFGYI